MYQNLIAQALLGQQGDDVNPWSAAAQSMPAYQWNPFASTGSNAVAAAILGIGRGVLGGMAQQRQQDIQNQRMNSVLGFLKEQRAQELQDATNKTAADETRLRLEHELQNKNQAARDFRNAANDYFARTGRALPREALGESSPQSGSVESYVAQFNPIATAIGVGQSSGDPLQAIKSEAYKYGEPGTPAFDAAYSRGLKEFELRKKFAPHPVTENEAQKQLFRQSSLASMGEGYDRLDSLGEERLKQLIGDKAAGPINQGWDWLSRGISSLEGSQSDRELVDNTFKGFTDQANTFMGAFVIPKDPSSAAEYQAKMRSIVPQKTDPYEVYQNKRDMFTALNLIEQAKNELPSDYTPQQISQWGLQQLDNIDVWADQARQMKSASVQQQLTPEPTPDPEPQKSSGLLNYLIKDAKAEEFNPSQAKIVNGEGKMVNPSDRLSPQDMNDFSELSAAKFVAGLPANKAALREAFKTEKLSRSVRAIMQQESAGNARAISPKGAKGLMQLMPATFAEVKKRYGLKGSIDDPYTNVVAGKLYYAEQLDTFGNDDQLALAAYNWGPGAVQKAQKKYGGSWDEILANAPKGAVPKETINYVAKVGGNIKGIEPSNALARGQELVADMANYTADNPVRSALTGLDDSLGSIPSTALAGLTNLTVDDVERYKNAVPGTNRYINSAIASLVARNPISAVADKIGPVGSAIKAAFLPRGSFVKDTVQNVAQGAATGAAKGYMTADDDNKLQGSLGRGATDAGLNLAGSAIFGGLGRGGAEAVRKSSDIIATALGKNPGKDMARVFSNSPEQINLASQRLNESVDAGASPILANQDLAPDASQAMRDAILKSKTSTNKDLALRGIDDAINRNTEAVQNATITGLKETFASQPKKAVKDVADMTATALKDVTEGKLQPTEAIAPLAEAVSQRFRDLGEAIGTNKSKAQADAYKDIFSAKSFVPKSALPAELQGAGWKSFQTFAKDLSELNPSWKIKAIKNSEGKLEYKIPVKTLNEFRKSLGGEMYQSNGAKAVDAGNLQSKLFSYLNKISEGKLEKADAANRKLMGPITELQDILGIAPKGTDSTQSAIDQLSKVVDRMTPQKLAQAKAVAKAAGTSPEEVEALLSAAVAVRVFNEIPSASSSAKISSIDDLGGGVGSSLKNKSGVIANAFKAKSGSADVANALKAFRAQFSNLGEGGGTAPQSIEKLKAAGSWVGTIGAFGLNRMTALSQLFESFRRQIGLSKNYDFSEELTAKLFSPVSTRQDVSDLVGDAYKYSAKRKSGIDKARIISSAFGKTGSDILKERVRQ